MNFFRNFFCNYIRNFVVKFVLYLIFFVFDVPLYICFVGDMFYIPGNISFPTNKSDLVREESEL